MENNTHSTFDDEVLLFPEMTVQYAGFWDRFAAAFIDAFILLIPNLILDYVLEDVTTFFISQFINWLYYALQESGPAQATLGKKIMGQKVTTEKGNRISFGQATGRYFGKFISSVILLIGYFMMIWDDKKQTLHDKMAGTLVVKSERIL